VRTKRLRMKKRLTALFLLLVGLLWAFVWQYRPLMLDSACNLARATAAQVVNRTVWDMLSEEEVAYDDLITVTFDDSGAVRALQANAARINRVKSETALRLKEAFSQHAVQSFQVPLGTLCGFTALSGIGPPLRCRSLLTALPAVSLEYHFDGAGINQTLHSIIMTVTVPLSVTLPLQERDTEVKASFLIGETILVGEVPDSYTNVISDPEVADDIFNYGDVG